MKKQEVLHPINTHAYTNLPKYGFSTDEENAYEIPGTQVCEIINGIVEKDGDQHNVYTLALMCGTGKSSAISLKIREAIEKREGLLVVTDRIKTLEEYTKPEKNKDLADYFKKHKDGFSLMKRENAARIKSTHCKAPVLLMSTQRYFRLSPDEIKEYLEWDGGKRNLVLIDEKPELYTSYKLTKEELRELYDIVEHEAPLSEGKIHFLLNLDFKIKIWFGYENITLDNQGKKKNTFCIINQEENEFDDLTDEEHPDIREPIEADNAYFNSIRELVERKNKNIVDIYDKYNYLRRHRCLMTYRADKDETFITKFRTNSEKLTDIDATVIILDGTADLSIDYYNQEYLHLHTNRKGAVRKLPNLHIRIVNTPGTSREELEKKNDLSIFREYVQAENKEQDSVCVFSYKTIYESFEADEEGEYKEDKLRPYLGNNRSRNDIQYIPVMGQGWCSVFTTV